MGFSLIDVVFAQSGQHTQIYVSSSYGTWLGHQPYYFHYPDYSYWTQYHPYYNNYTYNLYYNPYYSGDVEMRPGEAAAEWLFYQGIGEPWNSGNPPHNWWSI